MPTTLTGLLLFVLFLAPGFVYLGIRETRLPRRLRSAFRETALLVLVSVVANLLVVAVFAMVRAIWPGRTPDVGLLVRSSDEFLHSYYVSGLVWLTGGSLVACVIAALTAVWGPEFPGAVNGHSAWYLAFKDPRSKTAESVYLSCELIDGTYLGGYWKRFSTEPEETGDRDITLEAPIRHITPEGVRTDDLGVNLAIVSAREIRFMTVAFIGSTNCPESDDGSNDA